MENTSGLGKTSIVPEEIKGWNWGAFILSCIWAIGNKTWIGLLAIIPCVGIVMSFILGIKGNEWAWKNKKWESVEQFQKTQKKWTFWGIALMLLGIALGVLAILFIP